MIENVGIDIVENKRIENSISNNFLKMVLTDYELEQYNLKKGKKRLEYLCGRFASKEAIIKALSDYENPHFKEIEIKNEKNGKPTVQFKNYKILLSISHEKNYTIAYAILLR